MKVEILALESEFNLTVAPDTEEGTIVFILQQPKKETEIEISYEDAISLKKHLSLCIERIKNEFVNQT